uniref:Uncharacterized protein n=1 Tax=Caenorhabditis japonica TaxID=281687 RepID=A0A8R1E5V3_CAEJA
MRTLICLSPCVSLRSPPTSTHTRTACRLASPLRSLHSRHVDCRTIVIYFIIVDLRRSANYSRIVPAQFEQGQEVAPADSPLTPTLAVTTDHLLINSYIPSPRGDTLLNNPVTAKPDEGKAPLQEHLRRQAYSHKARFQAHLLLQRGILVTARNTFSEQAARQHRPLLRR